ncbi:hypothetical protein GCM10023116_03720 [Kistimonas scapharcae]|uniref:Excisionase n=1 Tax=Kistimonas scapharcae TaxID=1036133 RepID=A0ABP8UW17_9GAMM
MTRFVLIKKFCELTGYTPKAVERKIENGVWLKGRVWVKAPDGRRLVNMEEYDKWVEENQR